MAEYLLSPLAQRDLSEKFDDIVSQWGVAQASSYTDRIEAACADLSLAPLQAQDVSQIRPGYRRRGVAQHMIYFRPTSYGIAVIRILHQRMEAALSIAAMSFADHVQRDPPPVRRPAVLE